MDERTELRFDAVIQWDIDTLTTDFATWMAADNDRPAATSRVGILSSIECQNVLHHYLDENLCVSLRLLVKITSLLYNQKDSPHPCYGREQLNLVRISVGVQVLRGLEIALKMTALTRASREKLKGVFVVLFGAIIATTYADTIGFEEARLELLQILAHYMILVGERLGLLDCDVTKQRLVQTSDKFWNKAGSFEWSYDDYAQHPGCHAGKFPQEHRKHYPALAQAAGVPRGSPPTMSPRTIPPIIDGCLQVDLACSSVSQANLVACDSLGGLGIVNDDLSIANEWNKCFLCNGQLSYEGLCQACFGSLPATASYNNLEPLEVPEFCSSIEDDRTSKFLNSIADMCPANQDLLIASTAVCRFDSNNKSHQITSPTADWTPEIEKEPTPSSKQSSDRSITQLGDGEQQLQEVPRRRNVRKKSRRQRLEEINDRRARHSKEDPSLIRKSTYCAKCSTTVDIVCVAVSGPMEKCGHIRCNDCNDFCPEPGFSHWICCHCASRTMPYQQTCSRPVCRSCSRSAVAGMNKEKQSKKTPPHSDLGLVCLSPGFQTVKPVRDDATNFGTKRKCGILRCSYVVGKNGCYFHRNIDPKPTLPLPELCGNTNRPSSPRREGCCDEAYPVSCVRPLLV